MLRIKKNDTVVVIHGKDKGKRGAVLALDLTKKKIYVKGIGLVTRHYKARRSGETSGLRKKESAIHLSNVMPLCVSCDKPCRVSMVTSDGGVKSRQCHRCKTTF